MGARMLLDPLYVVDTPVLIWALKNDPQLSLTACQIFDLAHRHSSPQVAIATISLAEMYLIHEKVGLFPDFAAVYADLQARPYLRIIDFKAESVLDLAQEMPLPLHQRMIMGLARRLGAPLLTPDERLGGCGVPLVW